MRTVDKTMASLRSKAARVGAEDIPF